MPHPLLYEINTRCWLRELSIRDGKPISLSTVPETELVSWRRFGFTHIWLMGVWASGPRARAMALTDIWQRQHYSAALPDWSEEDVVGSPYAIADYRVPATLGGDEGLAEFRRRLHLHGLKLVLDFVPNHVGLDHPWVSQQPELFVQSPQPVPETFLQQTATGPVWLAHGKDPNFPAWTDTVQLDYRLAETWAAMGGLLTHIATQCDGVRCDMAMLLLNNVFARTWTSFPPAPAPQDSSGLRPEGEFWASVITQIRQARPQFLFLAEAYWGLEPRLQELGFDYTYDKGLYDRLIARDAAGAPRHLFGMPAAVLSAGAHFLENHDEPRVASLLSLAQHKAAALLVLSLPGMRFLHEGQLSGVRFKTPVQLQRRRSEPEDTEIRNMYENLLTVLTRAGQGTAELLRPRVHGTNDITAENIVLVRWQKQPSVFDLVTVNLGSQPSRCAAPLEALAHDVKRWAIHDLLGTERFFRDGRELRELGLYLELGPHEGRVLRFEAGG